MTTRNAIIVGVGDGLSASLARSLAAEGLHIHMVARNTAKLGPLREEVGGMLHEADATDAEAVARVIASIQGRLDIAVYNPSFRVRGPLVDLDPGEVEKAVRITAFGAFLLGQAAARRMQEQDGPVRGTILFTGASAGVKGFPHSASFAMGKFAQRGLAQSMSRELHPKGIHVVWINIDGGIRKPGADDPDVRMLDPDAIARAYVDLTKQDRSAWSHELDLRPWTETF